MKRLLFLLICVILMGCSNASEKNDFAYCDLPTNKLTCEQAEQCYNQCVHAGLINQVEYCRGNYIPALMRCYGCKK